MASIFDGLARLHQGGMDFKGKYEDMKARSDANFQAKHPTIKATVDLMVDMNTELADRAGAPGWAVKTTSPGTVFPAMAYMAGVVNSAMRGSGGN